MNVDKYLQQWAEELQPHVPEPLLAVGMLARAGQMMTGMVGMGSGIAHGVLNHQNKKKSGGLPPNVLAGLTASTLYLWKYRSKFGTTKLKIKGDPELVLDRSSFAVTIGGNDGLAHRLHFTFGDGQVLELDSHTSFGSDALNQNLINQLVAPAAGYAPPPAPSS